MMTFPRTVRYSTLVRFIVPVALAFLLVIVFALVVLDLVFQVSQGFNGAGQHYCEPQLPATEEQIKTLALEKQVLKAKLHECRADKSMEISETNKYLREENDKLNKKVYELLERRKEMSKEEGNVLMETLTVNREFFNYLTASLRDTPYPGVDNYTRYTVARLGLTPLVGVESLIPEFGPVINDVLSFKYPISVPPCRQKLKVDRTVFVIINSAPANFRKRQTIRQTWRNHLKDVHEERLLGVAGFAFILGLTEDQETQNEIEKEAKTYGDIIQVGIPDFYRNMSVKVAGLFNWLYRFCAKVEFVVKVDDDVYINVRNLAHFVESYHHPDLMSMFGSASQTPADFFTHRGICIIDLTIH